MIIFCYLFAFLKVVNICLLFQTIQLSFTFFFYGHEVSQITIATGGKLFWINWWLQVIPHTSLWITLGAQSPVCCRIYKPRMPRSLMDELILRCLLFALMFLTCFISSFMNLLERCFFVEIYWIWGTVKCRLWYFFFNMICEQVTLFCLFKGFGWTPSALWSAIFSLFMWVDKLVFETAFIHTSSDITVVVVGTISQQSSSSDICILISGNYWLIVKLVEKMWSSFISPSFLFVGCLWRGGGGWEFQLMAWWLFHHRNNKLKCR